ncbi:MAG: GH92 family glycosyl hydrolase [Deltaproteobacteria bacterium]|nr:GH92 family glycosyl hydrolase [Deltaproteobacteria bacterium]
MTLTVRFAVLGVFAVALLLSFPACDDPDENDESAPLPPIPGDDDDDDLFDDDASEDVLDLVDPFIGTGGLKWGMGASSPGPMVPNGMVKLGPDTSMGALFIDYFHAGGYWWPDWTIRGFSHTHLPGTGIADMGNIRVMPAMGVGPDLATPAGHWSDFRHETESARPGYYSVFLDRFGVTAELTATNNVGVHRYTYPDTGESPSIVINATSALTMWLPCREAAVTIDPATVEVSGFHRFAGNFNAAYGGTTVYFVARFSEPPTEFGTFKRQVMNPGSTEETGCGIGAYVAFTPGTTTVVTTVGISFVSASQARANLAAQAPEFDFDDVRERADSAWRARLADIEIEGGTPEQRTNFYSAIYHLDVLPTNFTEEGGVYQGFDGQSHIAEGFTYYTDLSLWDTFRAPHPLFALVRPRMNRDVIVSMLKMAEQGGSLPVWGQATGETGIMIGTHSDSVIGEAVVKGMTDFDLETAYAAMREQATTPVDPGGRDEVEDWVSLGYVAHDHGRESVSKTLEYAYEDYCVAQVADTLGLEADREMFLSRAAQYANVWQPELKYFHARRSDGTFLDHFHAGEFMPPWITEGNARHYRWFVPHDLPGLIALFGGEEEFEAELSAFFENAVGKPDTFMEDRYYWHGNEPDQHVVYMFNAIGRPDLTARWVRWIMDTKYRATVDGIDGNDDGGTLSAWYIFSALGFFPMSPCSGEYQIGSPIFARAEVSVDDGAGTLVVTAENVSSENMYVQSVRLNGEPLDLPWFRHEDIAHGGSLEFVMGPAPSGWGTQP